MANVLAVILARAGSKGLPNKCVAPLAGRAVIEHTFDAAQAARRVDAVCLSTDSEPAKALARSRGIAIVDRPAELANDAASVQAALWHAVRAFEQSRPAFRADVVVLLYGNVPIRPNGAIDRAIGELLERGCDSVRTVAPLTKQHPDWSLRLTEGLLQKFRENAVHRRQELEPLYYHDGAVVVVRREPLEAAVDRPSDPHAFFGAKRGAIVVGADEAVDIDAATDLRRAEALLSLGRPTATFPLCKPPRTLVIAEAGVNHAGRLDGAKLLIDAARAAGADAVKFQAFTADELVTRDAPSCIYQRRAAAADSQHAMLARLELSERDFAALKAHADAAGILFLCTPFGSRQARMLSDLGVAALKLASPDLVNLPLLEVAAATGLPLVCSTGAAEPAEIDTAVARLNRLAGPGRFALLHCVSSYPTPLNEANLAAISALAARHGVVVGYSDHTRETITGALAVAAGAAILEKHLTLDRSAAGPDHFFSLEPNDFAEYVERVREAEGARGSGTIELSDAQRETRLKARGSVVANRPIRQGERLSPENLTIKRPGGGIEPGRLSELLGRVATRDIAADTALRWEWTGD